MTTITNTEMKDNLIITILNNRIANKKIKDLYMFNKGFLLVSLQPHQNNELTLEKYESFLSIQDFKPYLHIMIPYESFTHIDIREVD